MSNSYEYMVYPCHGVGRIEDCLNPTFIQLRMLGSNMLITIPRIKAGNCGLRELITEKEAHKVIEVLNSKGKISIKTWNRRYREYMEKLKTGSAIKVAEVVRDIRAISVDKELSFGERKMIDSALNMLETELKIVLGDELCLIKR